MDVLKRLSVIAFLFLICSTTQAQVYTVQDIHDQNERTNQNVLELGRRFDEFSRNTNDAINAVGVNAILIFFFFNVALQCLIYLAGVGLRYINRRKIEQQRDKHLLNVEKELALKNQMINLLEIQAREINANLMVFQELFGHEFKPPHYNKTLFLGGIIACILGAVLAYQGNAGPADLLLILGFLSLLVCGLLYLFSIRRYFLTSEPIQCLANSTSESHVVEDVLGTTPPGPEAKTEPMEKQHTVDAINQPPELEVDQKDTTKPPKDYALRVRVLNALDAKKEGYLTAELQDFLALEGKGGYRKLLETLNNLLNGQKITFDMVGVNKRRWRRL